MEMPKVFSVKSIWSMSIVFVVILSAFLLLPRVAEAAVSFEAIRFRIDTELDVINAKGVTVRWTCAGGSGYGEITDGGAVASDSSADGLITVASASAENSATHAGCNATESITATVSLDGWVRRVWTDTITASTSNGITDPFTTRASMDYTITINGVDDELGTGLQLDGSTASASYSVAPASQSYSSYSGTYKKYIAATADGTVTAEKDGYVKTTSSTITGFSATASRTVDFGTGDDSSYNEVGLPFAVKVTVGGTTRFGGAVNGGTGRTVTAGDDSAISCTDGGSGNNYYCPVLLAQSTGLTATSDEFSGLGLTLTCTYTDRDTEDDGQTSCTINATESPGAGSGGGSTYTYETTPTPTPEVTPEVTPTPTPVPGLSPTPTPVTAVLYRKTNDPKVYVQGSDGTLTWVKTIEEFNAAGYKWSDVKIISGSEFAQMKISEGTPVAAALFRKANDPKVYVQGSDGTLTWVKTIEAFNTAGYSWANVKVISGEEFGKMRVGGNVRIVKGIAFLRVRSGPSTANSIVGQVLPGQELKFTEVKNGWYHINSGWVSGAYAKEF